MRRALLCAFITTLVLLSVIQVNGQGSAHTLAPGDRIKVTVLDEPDISREAVVDKNGTISLALLGDISIVGMTAEQASASIRNMLKEYVVKPEVSVELLEQGKIRAFVVGEVKKPGMVTLTPGSKMLEALTLAEYTESAELSKIALHRGSQVTMVNLNEFLNGSDVKRNMIIEGEDTIVVPRKDSAGIAQVLGEVNKPGTTQLAPGMTFRELIASAGGVTAEADTALITVKHVGDTQGIPVDYKRALAGDPSANPVISAGDMVYVPKAEESYYIIQGGVNQPGRYPLKPQMTIEEAAAQAGGFSRDARVDDIQIVHTSDGTSRSVKVNLSSIRSGKAPMVVLQPKDTVVVAAKKPTPTTLEIISGIASFGWIFTH